MKNLSWKMEQRKVKDLNPFSLNPRKIKKGQLEKLEKSLEKWDAVEIPCLNSDGTLINWHQRAKAMIQLGRGDEVIDVRIASRLLDKKEMKELNLTLNTHAGVFDFLDVIDNVGFEIGDVYSFDFGKNKKKENNYKPPTETETNIKEGDLIEFVGEDGAYHRLLCGDSTKKKDVEKLMNGGKADLLITDPPYGVSYSDKNVFLNSINKGNTIQNQIANDHKTSYEMFQFWKAFL